MSTALPRSAEGEGPRAIGHLAEQPIAHARDLILVVARDAAGELDTDRETAFAIARSLVARMGGTMTTVALRTESTCVEIHLPATRIPGP